MKDSYVDCEKLARNGRKTAIYFAASFLPHYRRVLFSHLLVFNLWSQHYDLAILRPFLAIFPPTTLKTFTNQGSDEHFEVPNVFKS